MSMFVPSTNLTLKISANIKHIIHVDGTLNNFLCCMERRSILVLLWKEEQFLLLWKKEQ
jgi:hypothetical protein